MDDPVQEFKTWYLTRPLITRTYLTVSFVLAALLSLEFVSPNSMYYTLETTFPTLQLWRPLTTLFYQGKLDFNFLFAAYFAYFGLSHVQTDLFEKKTYADFIWLVTYLYGSLLVLASIFSLYFIGDAFIFALLYIWCKKKPFQTVYFFFGFKCKSGYFPWVYLGFSVLMGQSFLVYIIGLLLGHLYIFDKEIILVKYHKDYLPTPNIIKRLVYKTR